MRSFTQVTLYDIRLDNVLRLVGVLINGTNFATGILKNNPIYGITYNFYLPENTLITDF
jgi:hypothetical protein